MSQTKYLSRKRPVSECKTLSQERWSQFPFEISKNEIRDDGFDDIKVDIQTKKDGFDSIKSLPTSASDDELDDLTILKEFASSDNLPQTSSSSSSSRCFLDLYQPKTVADLAVHNKKIAELEQWLLKNRTRDRGCKLLMLAGPSGCGKTAALQVLCQKLGIPINEWNSDGQHDIFYDADGEEVIYELSQVEQFAKFLKKSDHISFDKQRAVTLVLVEQIPYAFYRASKAQFRRQMYCIYCFLHADYLKGNSLCFRNPQLFQSLIRSPKRILPIGTAQQIGFHVISFNPCAVTFIVKALKQVLLKCEAKMKPEQIKRIAELSGGDIRSAINGLQLQLTGDSTCGDLQMRSPAFMDPFHCLGKLFYAKRSEVADAQWINNEKLLSPANQKHFRPFPPKDDVSEVIGKAGISGDKLALFVSEHECNFAPSLETLRNVLDNISAVDSALSLWEVRIDSSFDTFEAEVAARSTVFYNYGCKPTPGRTMYAFHKPRWKELEAREEAKKKEMSWSHPAHSNYEDFFSFTLPLSKLISFNANVYRKSVYDSISEPESFIEDEFEIEEIDE